MASATVDSTHAAVDGGSIQVESLPVVDLRLLSQAELYSLSQCSSSAVGPLRCDDVVIPKIDRSVFNESAGSRKQTYSRLRLAPASSSAVATSSVPRRRTPHLRPAAVTNFNNGNSDPEKEENSQIIALLKQLFFSNSNPEELIPVKIDYSNSVPQELSSFPSSSSSSVIPVNHKRKRGRPSRQLVMENSTNSTLGVNNANIHSHLANHHNKKVSNASQVFVSKIVEDGDSDVDKEALLNRDGVEVDLVALGTAEDPYAEEIRQRTEGLKSREELLRYLEGLNGKWGSSRKKRRIVDASMFGSALPIGWKLLLSLKKKQGYVWLYCRRYLSPSGRQFLSCKDISSYLLSLRRIEDTKKLNFADNNESISDAKGLASVSMANVMNQDDNSKENPVCHASSVFGTSTSSCRDMQVTSNDGDQPEDKVGKDLHSDECQMMLNGKDGLLHHQSSPHRDDLVTVKGRDHEEMLSSSTLDKMKHQQSSPHRNDLVTVKRRNHEEMLSSSTLDKMNISNGHIEAHERNHVKSAEESQALDGGTCGEPSSFCRESLREVELKGPISTVHNNISETSGVNASDQVVDRIVGNGNLGGVNEILLSNNENKSCYEGSVDVSIPQNVAGVTDDGCHVQANSSESLSPFPSAEQAADVVNKAIENSVIFEDSKQESLSGSGLFGSDDNVEAFDMSVNDVPLCLSMNEQEKFVDTVAQENHSAIRVEQHSNFEGFSFENGDGVPIRSSIPTEAWGDQNKELKGNMPTVHRDEKVVVESGSSETDKDARSSVQAEMQFGISSVPSWNGQASVKDIENEGTFLVDMRVQSNSNGSLPNISAHDWEIGTEGKMEKSEVDGVQNVVTDELFLSFSSQNEVNADTIIGIEGKILQHRSPAFETGKGAMMEDDSIRVNSSAAEECQQEQQSASVLLTKSCATQVSNDEYTALNMVSATSVNDPRFHDMENTENHKLSPSSGYLHTELHKYSDTIEQEKDLLGSFSVQCGTEKSHGVQPKFSNNDSSALENVKRGKSSGFGLPNSSLDTKTCELGTDFSMNYSGSDWGAPRESQVRDSGNDFMFDFSRNSLQPVEDVMAGGLWPTGEENVLPGFFTAATSTQVQPSSSFHAFDIMSDKDAQGFFGVNNNINANVEGMRGGRGEPVEYSFLGSNSSNPIPMANMQQGGGSSFWLDNNALMPNIEAAAAAAAGSSRSRSSSVCVWCRSVFYHEPIEPQMDAAGTIGSMCPACSARIPGQFNLL